MDPNFPTLFVPPDKQPTRIIQARLEIVSNVLQEFGYDQRQFNHQDIFFILATPCLFHQANEIRLLSIEVIAALYQFVGVEIRTMVDAIENLKPGLKDQIMARLDEIDQQAPGSKQVDRGLSLVPEEEQEENQSALLKKQKDNANSQKQDLDKSINNVSQSKNQDKLNNSSLKSTFYCQLQFIKTIINEQFIANTNIRSEGKMKMCSKCFFDEENLQKKDVIIIDEFDTKIANLGSSLETIQHTSLQQLEILNDINQEKDRLGQAIVEMGQKKQSLDNFIKTSQSSFQLGSVNLSDNQVSDFMELFNQQELLRNINLELQRSLDPLRDLRTFLKQQREKILQDIQLINQILNGKLSIQSENLHQQQWNGESTLSLLRNLILNLERDHISQIQKGMESFKQENLDSDVLLEEHNSYSSRNIFECQLKSYIGHISYGSEQQENQADELLISESALNQQNSIQFSIRYQQNQDLQNKGFTLVFIFPQEQRTFFIILNPQISVRLVALEFQKVLKSSQGIIMCLNDLILVMDRTFGEQNVQNGQILMCYLKQQVND
ncbi:unnamed protein product [Paramecium octaurelia]|uniref:Uncharacterized protein n=2 Tax=Paramecium octaurelia TaxID=43137 RepID=A0A8S1TL68_PAROT|nr:unnamed protein product [Paramecium octaurelia]